MGNRAAAAEDHVHAVRPRLTPPDPAAAPLSVCPEETKTHVPANPSACSRQHDSCAAKKAEATPVAAGEWKNKMRSLTSWPVARP